VRQLAPRHRRDGEGLSGSRLLSLLKSVGLPLTEFGAMGGHVTSGCAAIEA
jgi:hypothetical protein